jgi:NitT/TauT family transport system substrate-binding protein
VAGGAAAPAKPRLTAASLRLDFLINGKHAPFLLGVEKGFYGDQGIDLSVTEGKGSLAAVQLVANRSDTFAFADSAAAVTVAASGGAVRVVAVIQQRSPVVGISFKPLKQPADLHGKTVGLNPVGVGTVWEAFVAQNRLDPSKMTVVTMDGPALLPALLAGRLDATIGLVNTEGAAAPLLSGKEVHLLYFADFGTNTLSHGIVVHRGTIEQDPDLVRRFLAATVRAWDYAVTHRAEAVEALLKRFPDAKRDVIARQLELTIPLLHTEATRDLPTGVMAEPDIKTTVEILARFGGLKGQSPPADLYTNEFLPPGKRR